MHNQTQIHSISMLKAKTNSVSYQHIDSTPATLFVMKVDTARLSNVPYECDIQRLKYESVTMRRQHQTLPLHTQSKSFFFYSSSLSHRHTHTHTHTNVYAPFLKNTFSLWHYITSSHISVRSEMKSVSFILSF